MHKDTDLTSYVMKNTHLRGLKIKSLKEGVLNNFNAQYSKTFNNKLSDQILQEYSNIVTNRHLAAHGGDINMTFDEVSKAFESVKCVLDTLSNILNPRV